MTGAGGTVAAVSPHAGLFERILILPSFRETTLVSYWLDQRRAARLPGPYAFYLEWAEHDAAEFTTAAGPVEGALLEDREVRQFSKLPHSVYRIRLHAADGVYYSDPAAALGNWTRRDYLLAREIIRREYLRLTRYVGTRGWYLARKQWGAWCSACSDWNTREPTNAHCPICYGTGFAGGYHRAVPLWVEEGPIGGREHREDGVGVLTDRKQQVRVVACPYLTSKDVWYNPDTAERWSVEGRQELTAWRGRPLIYLVELRLIEPGDIVYDVPLSPPTEDSEGSL